METTISQYIQLVLQREPTEGEVDLYQTMIDEGEATLTDVRNMIIQTEEAQEFVYPIILAYQAIYGRTPDAEGLAFWVDRYKDVIDLQNPDEPNINEALVAVLEAFVNPELTPEFVDRYGEDPTSGEYIAQAYANVLNREPDEEGLAFWTARLDEVLAETATANPEWSEAQVTIFARAVLLEQFVSSEEYEAATADGVQAFLTAAAEGETWAYDNDLFVVNQGQSLSLEQALGLAAEDDLPSAYNITDAVFDAGAVTVEGAMEAFGAVTDVIAGATNADDVVAGDVFDWSLEDTFANLFGAREEVVFTGASSYAVTDDPADLGVLTQEEYAFLQGASNFEADFAGQVQFVGNTIELTTGTDMVSPEAEDEAFQTGDGNDTITGVVSALASERTLNPADQIDGGAGRDTLQVEVFNDFGGFTGDGGVTNVETIELTNASAIARNFNTTGIDGAEEYVLNANGAAGINLSALASTDALITINDQTSGAVTIAYAADVTDGTSTQQSVALNNVGTAATTTTAMQTLDITMAGVENLDLTVGGDNFVDLSDVAAARNITVAGDGNLTIDEVGVDVRTFDASAATGDISVDLTDTNATITSVQMGSGDDTIAADVGDLAVNATIAGGEGDDRLELESGAARTVQYNMTGIQTVALGVLGGALTFSATNAADITTIEATDDFAGQATFANMGSADITVDVLGANALGGTITSTHSGATVMNVTADDENQANDTNVTLTQSNSLEINVSDEMDYTGTVTAAAATSGVINTGEDTTGFDVVAANMVDLNVTAAGDLDLSAASNFSSVQQLTVSTAGDFEGGNFGSLAVANLSGAGSVDLGQLGAADQEYGVTVNASGLGDGLTIADIDVANGQSITINAAGVTGTVDLTTATINGDGVGTITVDVDGTGGNVDLGVLTAQNVNVQANGALGDLDVETSGANATVVGTNLGVNTIEVTASNTATISGGIQDDTITVTGSAAADAVATFTLSGGLGEDTFEFDGVGAGAVRATITDFNAGDELDGDFNGVIATALTALGTELDDARARIESFLEDAGISVSNVSQITNVFSLDATADGTGSDFAFQFGGATHVIVQGGGDDDEFDNGDYFVSLTGVTGLDTVGDVSALFA